MSQVIAQLRVASQSKGDTISISSANVRLSFNPEQFIQMMTDETKYVIP